MPVVLDHAGRLTAPAPSRCQNILILPLPRGPIYLYARLALRPAPQTSLYRNRNPITIPTQRCENPTSHAHTARPSPRRKNATANPRRARQTRQKQRCAILENTPPFWCCSSGTVSCSSHIKALNAAVTAPGASVFATPTPTSRRAKTSMTTNRPFFGGFLAAFRAQPTLQKAATSQAASAYAHTTTSNQTQNQETPGASRTITSKARSPSPGATTVSVQASGHFQPTRQHAPPYNRSTSPKAQAFPIPGATQRSRRGSDSSSEGFHEVLGAEKWYIGGRTATGEEKYYKLGMVKRHRSADRLSLDKLSI